MKKIDVISLSEDVKAIHITAASEAGLKLMGFTMNGWPIWRHDSKGQWAKYNQLLKEYGI